MEEPDLMLLKLESSHSAGALRVAAEDDDSDEEDELENVEVEL